MSADRSRETQHLAEHYRELKRKQRSLPVEEQWTMGAEVRRAKAEASLSIEYDGYHFDRPFPMDPTKG